MLASSFGSNCTLLIFLAMLTLEFTFLSALVSPGLSSLTSVPTTSPGRIYFLGVISRLVTLS
jgi:hypothetical protein